MEPFRKLQAKTIALPQPNIDTDQIIPARFLKITDKQGLGQRLFADWRYDAEGHPRPEFVLNQPVARGATVLVAGDNFGCGSSREHAPWALLAYGFRAVISSAIADIFQANALKNGLLPLVVDAATHRRLLEGSPAQVTIDLESQRVTLADGSACQFPIDPFSRQCLLRGVDELGLLLDQQDAISVYEGAR